MSETIDYGKLMHQAMRSLVRRVLSDVAQEGLPGTHHFFITFDTQHPDVEIANWLHDRYPEEMTIVIQHWFDALEVSEDGFSVTLNFGDAPENLRVPYDAIKTFVDPSVEFGLRFEVSEDDSVEDFEAPPPSDAERAVKPRSKQIKPEADIVSLDQFRK